MVDEPEFEELEQIPWAALATRRNIQPAHIGLALVGIAAVVGLALGITNGFGTPTEPDPNIAEPPAVASPAAPTLELAPEPTVAPAALGTETYSEADLMLIDIEEETRLAVAHAEWFVRDYLTVDGDPVVADRMALLVSEQSSTPSIATFVEWVDAFAISSPGPGTYQIEVLYRLLSDEGQGFVRRPAEAMRVEIAIDVDGSAQLVSYEEGVPAPVIRASDQAAS